MMKRKEEKGGNARTGENLGLNRCLIPLDALAMPVLLVYFVPSPKQNLLSACCSSALAVGVLGRNTPHQMRASTGIPHATRVVMVFTWRT